VEFSALIAMSRYQFNCFLRFLPSLTRRAFVVVGMSFRDSRWLGGGLLGNSRLCGENRVVPYTSCFEVDDDVVTAPLTIFLFCWLG
jgi:hypothetical protein